MAADDPWGAAFEVIERYTAATLAPVSPEHARMTSHVEGELNNG